MSWISSGDQSSVWMSKSMVLEALETSVACTAPPVRFQSSQESTVPASSSPASARRRRSGWSSRSQASFDAVK